MSLPASAGVEDSSSDDDCMAFGDDTIKLNYSVIVGHLHFHFGFGHFSFLGFLARGRERSTPMYVLSTNIYGHSKLSGSEGTR